MGALAYLASLVKSSWASFVEQTALPLARRAGLALAGAARRLGDAAYGRGQRLTPGLARRSSRHIRPVMAGHTRMRIQELNE